jgi:DNA helicase HerA-like ATPase
MTWRPHSGTPDPEDFRLSISTGTSFSESSLREAYAEASVTKLDFSERLLLRHGLVVGATGSGKTNHTFHIIQKAMERPQAGCFVIDVKKEYRRLADVLRVRVRTLAIGDEPRARFNPLAPPKGVSTDLWDRAFTDIFTRAYGLAEPSRRIILDSLAALRQGSRVQPTLRELERKVAAFETKSGKEQGSLRSAESRLHLINTGPVGDSLNSEEAFDPDPPERVTVFEIGRIDFLHDQRFLAELVLMQMWQKDKAKPPEAGEILRRLVVVEEAHRYLSEERPPEQRGNRTLLELAIAEARRYGWGFLVIDQMPLLLSRYVWDNTGTVLVHRLANLESYRHVKDALGGVPISQKDYELEYPIALRLPEDLAIFRRYVDPGVKAMAVGMVRVSQVA